MRVRRGFALLIMILSGVTHCEAASARMQSSNDPEADVLMRLASSSFHPVVKSFASDKTKPAVLFNKPAKVRTARKHPASKVYVPKSKSFVSMMKPAKAAANKPHVNTRQQINSNSIKLVLNQQRINPLNTAKANLDVKNNEIDSYKLVNAATMIAID